MNVSVRPATVKDFHFLYRLHRAAMRHYVEETWGEWDDDWQRSRFEERFNPAMQQVIQVDGEDVGMIELHERNEELFIAAIEVLPEYQNHGVGTQVLRAVLAQAELDDKPVALKVLKVNIKARDLYQRLGFGVTGENETHYIMAFEPRPRRS